uniref:Uncharacterized protein n=1 Tax=Leersia perrieri TaxID=77586 RepID=A0A0D9XW50_9ORYZ
MFKHGHLAISRITFEEGAILCNFLPLIQEHLPSAAEEIESDIVSLAQSEAEDNPLYDYPEELTEDEGDDSNSENRFSDLDGSDPEYEKEPVSAHETAAKLLALMLQQVFAKNEKITWLADRTEDSQLFPSIPALNQAASYLAQTASYLTQCLPVSGYTRNGPTVFRKAPLCPMGKPPFWRLSVVRACQHATTSPITVLIKASLLAFVTCEYSSMLIADTVTHRSTRLRAKKEEKSRSTCAKSAPHPLVLTTLIQTKVENRHYIDEPAQQFSR